MVRMEHNHGVNEGLAEISSVVIDASGAVIPRTAMRLRRMGNGQVREALTEANGAPTLAGLATGRYACRSRI